MGLFTPSLYRSFAIGFALGALGLVATLGGGDTGLSGGMVGHAVAAPAVTN